MQSMELFEHQLEQQSGFCGLKREALLNPGAAIAEQTGELNCGQLMP